MAISHVNITDLMRASAAKGAYQQIAAAVAKTLCSHCRSGPAHLPVQRPAFVVHGNCRIAVDLAGLTMAWVGEPNLETERIVPVASYGTGRSFLDGIFVSTRADVPEGRGPTGIAFRENRATINQNFQIDPNIQPWRGRSTPFHWQSLATFPVRHAGAVVALLERSSQPIRRPSAFWRRCRAVRPWPRAGARYGLTDRPSPVRSTRPCWRSRRGSPCTA